MSGDEKLFLFEMKGSKKPEYWTFIKLIAPDDTKKQWKTSECVGVYCTKCQLRLKYSQSNPSLIPRHMNKIHKSELLDFELNKQRGMKRKYGTRHQHFHSAPHNKVKMATETNQKRLELLSAMWTSTALRPFRVVEDIFLQQIVDFAQSVNGTLKLPSRNLNRKNVMSLANWMEERIKEQIQNEMEYFSVTTDLWSSRRMLAFMSLTLHYLTEDFEMREFTLEASPVKGNHNADMIRESLTKRFDRWGLREGRLSLLLRDSASNCIKACDDWGIEHSSCFNHLMHLLVGPFLLKQSKCVDENAINADRDEVDYEDDLDTFYDNDDAWSNEQSMREIRNIVDDFRKATIFLKRSIKCKELLEKIQSLQNIENPLSVHLVVRTRSNSTYLMLRRMIKMQTTIKQFQVYYKSAEGRRNFKSTKTIFPNLSDEKWAIVHGLCFLLAVFNIATNQLGGQKYSTFVSALPSLRGMKEYLADAHMFDMSVVSNSTSKDKFKIKFQNLYGECSFFQTVLEKLETCRKKLLEGFTNRFKGMDEKIMWTSLFDPRYAAASHLTEFEKKSARVHMQQELRKLIVSSIEIPPLHEKSSGYSTAKLSENADDDSEFDVSLDYVHTHVSAPNSNHSPASKLKEPRRNEEIHIDEEVESYLTHCSRTSARKMECPLD